MQRQSLSMQLCYCAVTTPLTLKFFASTANKAAELRCSQVDFCEIFLHNFLILTTLPSTTTVCLCLPIKFQFTTLTALCSIVFEKIKYNKKSKNEASYGPYREWIFNNVATILRPLNFQSLCMKKKIYKKRIFFRGNKQTTRKIQEWAENCVADVCGSGVVK